jgi:Skp family chaperone for outer membrane proteins
MMKRLGILLLVAVVVAFWGRWLTQGIEARDGEGGRTASPSRIGVVDLERVFGEWNKAGHVRKILRQRGEELEQAEDNLRRKEEELGHLKEGSGGWEKLREEVAQGKEAHGKEVDEFLRKTVTLDRLAFGEILGVIEGLGKERGLEVVLQKPVELPEKLLERMEPRAANARFTEEMVRRGLLYSANSLDLTAEVVRRLNEKALKEASEREAEEKK